MIQNRLFLIMAGAVAFSALSLYLFFYAPLMGQLKIRGSQCREFEAEVSKTRNLIGAFKAQETDKVLIPESEVSLTLEELTRQGNFTGVAFSSVTPRSIEESEHRILPIEMELESNYESLGKFLGVLDGLGGSLTKVRDFNVTSKSDDPGKLQTRLTINLYLAEGKHAG